MANIGWDETSPADNESAGLGDDRIRSLKTSLRQGLGAEHTWPSGGGDSGIHLLGSARAYYGPQSAVSSSGTDGRLMVTSDTSNFFHVGSAATVFLGGPRVITRGNYADPTGMPQRSYWAEEMGQDVTGANGSVVVTIPNSGFSGQPLIFISGYSTGVGRNPTWGYIPGGANTFTVTAFDATFSSAASVCPFTWRSIGSRVL